ncbi:MAG: hypothetical protein ACR2IJ_01170 [Fluviibacter sp.]
MPNFETWERDTLNKFAYDSYAKLLEQAEQLQQLQCDLKDAIAAYRELMLRDTQPR